MSSFDIKTIAIDYGAFIGTGPRPLAFISNEGGDITVLDAKVTGMAAGTAIGLALIVLTDVGTPAASGTVGSFAGTVVYSEGVTFGCTIATAVVDVSTSGQWLGIEQTSGTAPANAILTVNYITGK